ncbi:MAG: hypothetical protein IKJ16_02150 [Agathobacter sp.]|nr:hypothetical protein [Agathobacter sp.]
MQNEVFEYMEGKNDRINRLQKQRLSEFYQMCLLKGKSDTYNEVLMDDILINSENIERYAKGIEGFHIVETSCGHRSGNEYAIIMKCSAHRESKYSVKLIFENKNEFWRQYYKLTDSEQVDPIIVAGDWETTPNETEFQSQCIIHRRRQIYYVNE